MAKDIVETYRFRQFVNLMDEITPSDNHSREYKPSKGFCNHTWEESKKLAFYGVPMQRELEKIISSMALLEKVKTKGYDLSEHGLAIDIGTYLSGDPECWVSEVFNYKPKKVVKVLISIAYISFTQEQQIKNRGAGIISLIQMLKKQGYIVKVSLYDSGYYNGKNYTCFITIPTNPLDLQSLSYALCDSSLSRRFLFAWLESVTKEKNCNGYGQVRTINEVAISKDIIHFQGLNQEDCEYQNEQSTKQYIMKTFEKFLELNGEKNDILS